MQILGEGEKVDRYRVANRSVSVSNAIKHPSYERVSLFKAYNSQ